jgi:hypothetical protein
MKKYVVKFWIPVNPQWEVWDEEIFEFWNLEEVLEKIRRRRKMYKDPYSVYKVITDIQKKEEYEEMKSAIEQRPQKVTVTLEVNNTELSEQELNILVSFLKKKGAEIKIVMDGTEIQDLENLLILAKKAYTSVKINITDDVYNLLQTSQP